MDAGPGTAEPAERGGEDDDMTMTDFMLRMHDMRRRIEAAKQEHIKEQVRKFDKFLKDNDAKRVRASRKARREAAEVVEAAKAAKHNAEVWSFARSSSAAPALSRWAYRALRQDSAPVLRRGVT